MKYYRINQIAMAVLGALLLIFGTRTIMQIAFEEHAPEKPGMEVAGMEVAGAKHGEEPGAEKPAAASQLPALLAKGDAAKGETAAAVCKVCHGFDAGAPSPIGPNLHNVVGRKIASVEGFNYSPALKAKSGEDWTYDNLEHFIHKPAEYAPGTLMAFPGIPDAQQLADVILFLRTKTDNPPPLPEVTAAPAEAAPAAEAAKPAADPNVEVAALVAKADPAKGESAAAMCKVCHAVEKGAASLVGPNLYGVIGRPIASVEGFNYSPALKAKASEGDWDYAHIDAFIHKPMEYAPGTMMAFPGIPDANQRAEVIAWLRTKADSPAPLPEAAAAAPEAPKEEEKPAEAAPAPATEQETPAEAAPAPAAEDKAAETPAETPAAPAPEERPAEAAPAPAEQTPAEAAPAPQPSSDADYAQPSTATQPQPVTPDAGDGGDAGTPAAPPAEEKPAEAAPSSQPQPVYPDGPPQ